MFHNAAEDAEGGEPAHEVVHRVAEREQQELERRERAYRGNRPPPEVRGRTAILVDDGLATGASMQAAIMALRRLQRAEDQSSSYTLIGATRRARRVSHLEMPRAATRRPVGK